MSKEISGLENVTFESSTTYTFLEEIGRGGMGIVYLAERSCMGVSDLVVLKTVRTISREQEEKLRQEANIATQLRHENIVKTYGLEALPVSALPEEFRRALDQGSWSSDSDFDYDRRVRARAGRHRRRRSPSPRASLRSASMIGRKEASSRQLLLIVMDYIDGVNLHHLVFHHIKKGYLMPPILGAFVASRICRALAYAHTTIVHRDISPENIMINRHGVCKLSDFGIAVAVDEGQKGMAGKSLFMSPEALAGEEVDERTDTYSLGVCLYYLLTGILPFWTDPTQELSPQIRIIREQVEKGVPSPHEVRPDVPPELSEIVMRMIEPDRDRRYARVGVVGDELEQHYLYARGFGPTNNSLAAYVNLFEKNFTDYDEQDLGQLSFLRDESGRVALERQIRIEDYTRAGQLLIKERGKGSPIYRQMALIQKEERTARAPRPAARSHQVKVKYGDNLLETFELVAPITFGRDHTSSCVLPDPAASRNHARIGLENGVPWVEDLGSNNGTFLNRKKVMKAKLREGDCISIGRCHAFYMAGPPPAPPPTCVDLSEVSDGIIQSGGGGADSDLSLCLPLEDEPVRRSLRIIEKFAEESGVDEVQRQVLALLIDDTFAHLRRVGGKRVEVHLKPSSERFTLELREMDDASLLDALFQELKRLALGPEATARVPIPLKSLDRIELVRSTGELRLTRNLI